jgi:hypothetical protein
MTKDEALREAIDTLKSTKHGNCDFAWIDETLKKCTEALAQPPLPVQEPVACRFCHSKKGCWTWQCYHCGEIDDVQQPAPLPVQEPVAYDKTEMNSFVIDLYDKKMQEGKHGHYEIMFHVVHQAIKRVTLPLPVQEPVGEVVEVNNDGFRCEFNRRLAVGAKLYIAPPLPVQEPKKRCCDHDSDCSVHNGNALPVGPCDCSQTFISSPDLGIVVTVSYQLAVRELAKLVENNFGQMPRNDEWADKVLLVRDTFEAARNKGAKP